MNTAISQVVDGSKLAEQAGDQMKRTQETAADLVAAVQQIASRSQDQARMSSELLSRAQQIQEGTRQTSQQLNEQTVQTTNLVEYARSLLNSCACSGCQPKRIRFVGTNNHPFLPPARERDSAAMLVPEEDIAALKC